MNRRRYGAFVIAALIFLTGLALGAGKSDTDTSLANTMSKVLLSLGFLAFLIAVVLAVVDLRRSRA
jgi:hypothetical protein